MKNARRQYTIRQVPDRVDRVLRRRARESGKSFNQVALEALMEAVGEDASSHDDLDFLIGSMSEKDAKAVEGEVALQRRVDPELWPELWK